MFRFLRNFPHKQCLGPIGYCAPIHSCVVYPPVHSSRLLGFLGEASRALFHGYLIFSKIWEVPEHKKLAMISIAGIVVNGLRYCSLSNTTFSKMNSLSRILDCNTSEWSDLATSESLIEFFFHFYHLDFFSLSGRKFVPVTWIGNLTLACLSKVSTDDNINNKNIKYSYDCFNLRMIAESFYSLKCIFLVCSSWGDKN